LTEGTESYKNSVPTQRNIGKINSKQDTRFIVETFDQPTSCPGWKPLPFPQERISKFTLISSVLRLQQRLRNQAPLDSLGSNPNSILILFNQEP